MFSPWRGVVGIARSFRFPSITTHLPTSRPPPIQARSCACSRLLKDVESAKVRDAVKAVQRKLAENYIKRVTDKKTSLQRISSSVQLGDVFVHPHISSQERNLTLETKTSNEEGLTSFRRLSQVFKSDVLLHQPSDSREKKREGIDIDEVFLSTSRQRRDIPETTLVLGPPGSGENDVLRSNAASRLGPEDTEQPASVLAEGGSSSGIGRLAERGPSSGGEDTNEPRLSPGAGEDVR